MGEERHPDAGGLGAARGMGLGLGFGSGTSTLVGSAPPEPPASTVPWSEAIISVVAASSSEMSDSTWSAAAERARTW